MLPTDHFTAAIDGEGCSRGKSRVVRNYFNSILIPKLKLDPTTLSDTCIINTKSDIYALQEISKTETDNRDWKVKHNSSLAFVGS